MFLGFAKLLQWIPWSLLLWQIRAWAPTRPSRSQAFLPGKCQGQCLGNRCKGASWFCLSELGSVYQILPLFWRLYYDKIPYIGLPYISITHALRSKFTWVFMQERCRQERQTKAQNPDLEMFEKPSQASLLVLSSKDLPYGSPSGMQKSNHSIKRRAICSTAYKYLRQMPKSKSLLSTKLIYSPSL